MADGTGFDARWELLFEDAWDDPELKQRLLTDANTVLKERGIKIPEGQEIRFVENTENVEYLILPGPPAQDELADEHLEAVAGGGCPSACGGGGGCGGGGACGGGGGCSGSRGSFGSRGSLSSRGCRSCRGSRGSRNCRP